VTGRGGIWLGEVLAVRLLQGPLLVQPHALDTEHRPLHQPRPAAGGRALLPLADPPPAGTGKGKGLSQSRSERLRAGLCPVPHRAEHCWAGGFSHPQPRGIRGREMCTGSSSLQCSAGPGVTGGVRARAAASVPAQGQGARTEGEGWISPRAVLGMAVCAEAERGSRPRRDGASCVARALQTSNALRQSGDHGDFLPRRSGTHSQARWRGEVQNHGCKPLPVSWCNPGAAATEVPPAPLTLLGQLGD